MATFKEISPGDITTTRSSLNQLVDFIAEDISGSATRKKYQVFVTGGVGPGVTSSLFQTIFDQDHSLQTANAMFDITLGVFSGSTVVSGATTGEEAGSGKLLFPSTSLMMREKIGIYNQFAQLLLGNANASFYTPLANQTDANRINVGLFLCFKRLFARDQIKKETYAVQFYQSASHKTDILKPNLNQTSESGSIIFTDVGAATNQGSSVGGSVCEIVEAGNTGNSVGLLFYDMGIAVLDLEKAMSGTQHVTGVIDAMSNVTYMDAVPGKTIIGDRSLNPQGNPAAKFIPDFIVSASMDNILDYFASCRFQSSSITAMTFQNITNINSTLIFCRSTADEFNYSSNPTFTDTENRIRVIDNGSENTQKAFSFITTVGLYDANDNLLAVGKLSRPVEKNDEKDLTFRIRLDF